MHGHKLAYPKIVQDGGQQLKFGNSLIVQEIFSTFPGEDLFGQKQGVHSFTFLIR